MSTTKSWYKTENGSSQSMQQYVKELQQYGGQPAVAPAAK